MTDTPTRPAPQSLATTLRTLAATPEAVTIEAAQALLTIADRVEAMEGENARLREALQAVSNCAGNLPDATLESRSGANDAVARGLMVVKARMIARAALAGESTP